VGVADALTTREASKQRGRLDRLPPHVWFLGSAVFHYLGPAFAVLLFVAVQPLGVAWLRIVTAATIFAVWRRPWRSWHLWDSSARWTVALLALVLAAMNSVFYLAINRLPLGTVAAIEFVPVIILAAIAVRTRRNLAALVLAFAGVYLLTDVQLTRAPTGLLFAGCNAVLFATYIICAHRVAQQSAGSGIDGLAMAMLGASLVVLPVGIGAAKAAFTDPRLLLAAAGVGICSSVIPYVCDQMAMRWLSRGTYALMVSLLPAMATVIGLILLRQIPHPLEIVGIGLVAVGVALHRDHQT
jgi:inner membrane transporter RhtA